MSRKGLRLILGPMYAGKSTELVRELRREEIVGSNCLVLKYAKDVRYNNQYQISTHDSVKINARPCTKLSDVNDFDSYDVIAIDEGQFFPDLHDFVLKALKSGKHVIVSALNGTFEGNPWPVISSIIPYAHVTQLTAICQVCKCEGALQTYRKTQSRELEVIGGKDDYEARCFTCFMKK